MHHQIRTLESVVQHVACGICTSTTQFVSQTERLQARDNQEGLLGRIVWLPGHKDTPQDSCARTQRAINNKAFDHPVVIVSQSECRDLVFCLPITSFGGTNIVQKFNRCGDRQSELDRYMALNRHDTISHNEYGGLNHSGRQMNKQSYVHLEFGFWIEWSNLKSFGRRFLSDQSLQLLRQLYTHAELDRQQNGSQSDRRLGRISPPSSRQSTSPSPTMAPPSNMSWRSRSPTTASFGMLQQQSPAVPLQTVAATNSNVGADLVLPRRGDASIAIRAPPSLSKEKAMAGNWRRTAA